MFCTMRSGGCSCSVVFISTSYASFCILFFKYVQDIARKKTVVSNTNLIDLI